MTPLLLPPVLLPPPQNPYVRYQISASITINNPYNGIIPSALPQGSVYTNYLNPTIVSGSSSGSAAIAAVSLVRDAMMVPSELGGVLHGEWKCFLLQLLHDSAHHATVAPSPAGNGHHRVGDKWVHSEPKL